jgi:hypothetical protein
MSARAGAASATVKSNSAGTGVSFMLFSFFLGAVVRRTLDNYALASVTK